MWEQEAVAWAEGCEQEAVAWETNVIALHPFVVVQDHKEEEHPWSALPGRLSGRIRRRWGRVVGGGKWGREGEEKEKGKEEEER